MAHRSIRALTFLAFGGCALLLLGCPSDNAKIAVVTPLKGEAATYGEAVKRGIELAFEEIKADPNYEGVLELEVFDSESDPEKAKELLKEAFKNGAVASIGGITTGEAKNMIEVVDRFDRVLLSPSASSPELTGISRNFYRICPSDHTAASKMAQSAAQDLEIATIVIIAEEQPYATDIQNVFGPAFEGYGGEVLEIIGFPPGTTDLAALVNRAVSLEPDGVYLAGYADGIGDMISELRRLGFKGKILTTSAFATSSAIAKVGDAADGVFLTQTVFDTDSDHAHIQKFVNAYREKYQEDPDIYSALGYDAMQVLAAAMNGRSTVKGELKKGLRDAIKDFAGVTGSIQFDEKGDVRKFPRLYVIKDLLLVDYNDRVRRKQEEIRKRREELQKKLNRIQSQAAGNG